MRLGRQSNLELLRIVSMLFIIMLHIGAASIGLPAPLQTTTSRDIWVLIVESFSIIGVNCFALISGYFGIKASWRSFARFTLLCVVYAVSIYTFLAVLDLVPWSWNTWIKKWLVYTHSELWYVPAYLGLFLLSPFLNQAKSEIGFAYGQLTDSYLNNNVSLTNAEFDQSRYNFFSGSLCLEQNSLQTKNYPIAGSEHLLVAQIVTGKEYYTPAHTTLPTPESKKHTWLQLKGRWQRYTEINKYFNLII